VKKLEPNAIEAIVGWMDAMRRGDLQAIAGWFHPQVTWRGVPDDAICRNRDDVLEMLRDSLVPCPDDLRLISLTRVSAARWRSS
jgi:ketosteroid isomerase-like protein